MFAAYLRDIHCVPNAESTADGRRCISESQDGIQSASPETQCRWQHRPKRRSTL